MKTCCVIGHRDFESDETLELKIKETITELIVNEKVNKFLGETDFSISSSSFMKNPSSEYIEKYIDQRDGIFSRRESRTPVRVYFIPVKNKYFNCYYVINVNYKDHNHYDGGCSNDDVYNRRMQEVKKLEKMLKEIEAKEKKLKKMDK